MQNAASAGIITLLTVQNTRRETVMSSVRRVLAFCIMTLLSMPLYHFCGTEPWTFGLVLLLLLLICYGLHMEDSTPINAVMATHYMLAGGVTSGMVGNELLLLLIGSGIGVCLNWFMPRNRNRIQRMQQELDGEIQGILERMAVRILEADHTGYGDSCFAKTEQLSAALRREIDIFLQNQTWEDDTYWMRYVMMRREQCRVLEEMYRQLLRLTQIPEQAKPLSEFFGEVAQHFHEGNDCTALLARLEQLHTAYQEDALPETREAFENRALLYCILTELRTFYRSSSSSICPCRSRSGNRCLNGWHSRRRSHDATAIAVRRCDGGKKTISEAAASLYLAQPSLTKALKELEKEMGITIFTRTNRGVAVSKEGEVFLGYARQVLEQAALIEEKYLAHTGEKQEFCVSTQHYSFAVNAFVSLIRACGREHYDFRLRETQTYEILEDVAKMKSEIGILYLNPFNEAVLRKLMRAQELESRNCLWQNLTSFSAAGIRSLRSPR